MDESLISGFKNVSKMEMEKLITGKGGMAKIFTGYQKFLLATNIYQIPEALVKSII